MARTPTGIIPLEARLSYRCAMIATRIARFLAPMWESRYGLSADTWRAMAIIARYGPTSAKDVATRTSTDAFHVSRAVDRLVRKRLVKRNVDSRDRRRVRLELTPAGRRAHRDIEQTLSRIEEELLAGLDRQERQRMTSAFAMIEERALNLGASGLTWRDFSA